MSRIEEIRAHVMTDRINPSYVKVAHAVVQLKHLDDMDKTAACAPAFLEQQHSALHAFYKLANQETERHAGDLVNGTIAACVKLAQAHNMHVRPETLKDVCIKIAANLRVNKKLQDEFVAPMDDQVRKVASDNNWHTVLNLRELIKQAGDPTGFKGFQASSSGNAGIGGMFDKMKSAFGSMTAGLGSGPSLGASVTKATQNIKSGVRSGGGSGSSGSGS